MVGGAALTVRYRAGGGPRLIDLGYVRMSPETYRKRDSRAGAASGPTVKGRAPIDGSGNSLRRGRTSTDQISFVPTSRREQSVPMANLIVRECRDESELEDLYLALGANSARRGLRRTGASTNPAPDSTEITSSCSSSKTARGFVVA